MPHAKSKAGKRTQSIQDSSEIERVVKIRHDDFEHVLLAEWDIDADSAKVRFAMQPEASRCRQCKRPAVRFSRTCTCGSVEYEPCLSNPRNTLLELLRQRCQSVLASASLAQFVECVTTIGIANGHNLEWVKDQIQLWPSVWHVCCDWIIRVCGQPFAAGRLPAWLKDKGVIAAADRCLCLDTDDSQAELILMQAGIEQLIEEAKKKAFDQASIQMAQVGRIVPERVPLKRARQAIIPAMIATVTGYPSSTWIVQQLREAFPDQLAPRFLMAVIAVKLLRRLR